MKTIMAWLLLLWLALTFDQAGIQSTTSGSLLMSVAVGCIFWLRSSTGCLLAGLVLLIRWILQPTAPPIDIAVVLILSTFLITRTQNAGGWKPVTRSSNRWSAWSQPVVVLLCGLTCSLLLQTQQSTASRTTALAHQLSIALPCLLAIVLTGDLARHLGWRRTQWG